MEFTESLSGTAKESIRQAICAFANDLPRSEEPGRVLVGIRDDGTPAGLTATDRMLTPLADMKTDGNILPPPVLSVEKQVLDGGEVIVVTVQPSDSPPVRCKGVIFIRIGSRRGTATAQDERFLNEKRKYGNLPYDLHPVPSAAVSDLDMARFEHEYLPGPFSPETLAANQRTRGEQLAATNMIASVDDPVPTVAGLLTIGKRPRDFIPGSYIQFLRFDGTALTDELIDSAEIGGAVPDVLRRLDDKLAAHNRTAVDFVSRFREARASVYPMESLRQIVRNAIMHRSYEATHAPTHVHWYSDRIEVMSPGGPFGRVTAANFGEGGMVDYRNPNLASAMKVLGFVQGFGIGIALAREQLVRAGHVEPHFEVGDNYVRATVLGKEVGRAMNVPVLAAKIMKRIEKEVQRGED